MRTAIIFICLVLTSCTSVPVVKINSVESDSKLIALALSPPTIELQVTKSLELPYISVEQVGDSVLYIMKEVDVIKLIDFIGTSNTAIIERNEILFQLDVYIKSLQESALLVNKAIAN